MVFCRELLHGLVKHSSRIDRAAAGAFALVMDDFCGGNVTDLPSRGVQAVTQIQILAIHKEIRVESADAVQRFAPDKHERTADGVNIIGCILVEISQVVASGESGARK